MLTFEVAVPLALRGGEVHELRRFLLRGRHDGDELFALALERLPGFVVGESVRVEVAGDGGCA